MKHYWQAQHFFTPALVERGPAGEPAGAFSNKPIRFIVPYGAGGPGDLLARLIVQKLSELIKQPVRVENIPGEGGMPGYAEGLKAPADGYTLMLFASPFTINPSMYSKLPYDTLKDFQAVTLMIAMPNILVINRDLPVNSVADLIARAKTEPGTLKYASGGVGTPSHLGAELLETMAGIDIEHVTYKGHAPAGAAVQKGEVAMLFDAILLALPEVREGKIKALAVTSAERSNVAPEVPSVAESGLPGFDFSPGVGVLVRAGTPQTIVNKLYDAIRRVLALPDVRERLMKNGADIVASRPAEFSVYIEQEIAKWAKVVKASGLRPQ